MIDWRNDPSFVIYKRNLGLPIKFILIVLPFFVMFIFAPSVFMREPILLTLFILATLILGIYLYFYFRPRDLAMNSEEIIVPHPLTGKYTRYSFEELLGYKLRSGQSRDYVGYLQIYAKNGESFNIGVYSVQPWDKFSDEIKKKLPNLIPPCKRSDLIPLYILAVGVIILVSWFILKYRR